MTNDEILQRMTELLREYTIPVERVYVPGELSKYHWTNADAEKEFLGLFELLRKSFE